MQSEAIQRNYLILTLLNTLAGSFIWGINTLFLLDAGLSNTEAFAANAFFTAGMVVFEIPTGVFADTVGRRASYLLGTATLIVATLLYFILWKYHSPFWAWAVVSITLGLGFTFFTGATDAWLVDALQASGFTGALDGVFAKAQIVSGIAMLTGATAGGFIAQYSNLGVPYILRVVFLFVSFTVATIIMHDIGFIPRKMGNIRAEVKTIFLKSIENGIRIPAIRWVMFTSPFMAGVGIYGFYAAQPYLLKLYGQQTAYGVAGAMASLLAATQIAGGLSVPLLGKFFKKRTSIFAIIVLGSGLLLCLLGLIANFWIAILLIGLWGLLNAAFTPVHQGYLNKCIRSDQRATILSFDGLMGSMGGVFFQPALGKTADVWGYSTSFVISGIIQLMALPFVLLARRQRDKADTIEN